MGQSLTNIVVHATFSTLQRRPCLTEEVQCELFPYIGGVLNNIKCQSLTIGGYDDHVHALFVLGKTEALSDVMSKVKSNSSKWLEGRFHITREFDWQSGYAAFSIGRTEVDMVRHYIANQKEHHKTVSFQDELRTLCAEFGVNLDERYAWLD